jgi:hypothetical protein
VVKILAKLVAKNLDILAVKFVDKIAALLAEILQLKLHKTAKFSSRYISGVNETGKFSFFFWKKAHLISCQKEHQYSRELRG